MLNLFSSKKVGSNQKYKKSGSIGNLGEPQEDDDDDIDMNKLEILDDRTILNEPTI